MLATLACKGDITKSIFKNGFLHCTFTKGFDLFVFELALENLNLTK